ncbi:MAG TPA: polysaccharide deacetylase family protein [Candidatus Paceibacterota bacterium]|nr:polysaccharide deacetylase family protein [Candidatus Paceibacterota bacterium]
MTDTIVTTSWDDGHILDMKLSDLLSRYGLPATFYIAPENREIAASERLSKAAVRSLSERFEIGAHTMTHPRLSRIDDASANAEIATSKSVLEDWTGKPVSAFCYPGGDFTPAHEAMVKDAGFAVARTVKRFSFGGGDRFAMPTTVHAYRHWSDVSAIAAFSGIKNFLRNYLHWDDLAIALFEHARKNGGTFHLWGHSWEIEKNGDWNRLERVFRHIGRQNGITYKTNSQLA